MTAPSAPPHAGAGMSAQAPNGSGPYLDSFMVLSRAERAAVGAICLLAGPVTFLGNALVLGLIASSAALRRRPSFLFMGSLALADILASGFYTASFVDFHLLARRDGPDAYLLKLGGVTAAFTGSVGSLLLTALDRFLCLHRAARYKELLTPRRAAAALLLLWGATLALSFLPLLGWRCRGAPGTPCSQLFPYVGRDYLACWTACVLLALGLILGAYALVLLKARRHQAAMLASLRGTGAGRARLRMDVRLARSLGLVVAALAACWLPGLGFMAADVAVRLSPAHRRAFAFCSTLCLVNSAANPLLYALRCRELRRAMAASRLGRLAGGVACRCRGGGAKTGAAAATPVDSGLSQTGVTQSGEGGEQGGGTGGGQGGGTGEEPNGGEVTAVVSAL